MNRTGAGSRAWALLCPGCWGCSTSLCWEAHADPTQAPQASLTQGAPLAWGLSLAQGASLTWGTHLCRSTPQTCSAPWLWQLHVPAPVGGKSLLHRPGCLRLEPGCKQGAGFVHALLPCKCLHPSRVVELPLLPRLWMGTPGCCASFSTSFQVGQMSHPPDVAPWPPPCAMGTVACCQ